MHLKSNMVSKTMREAILFYHTEITYSTFLVEDFEPKLFLPHIMLTPQSVVNTNNI